MAFDNKYGRIILEHGHHIPEDEPVFIVRAQDKLLLKVLGFYLAKALEAGSPQEHLDKVIDTANMVREWQATHTTKVPD